MLVNNAGALTATRWAALPSTLAEAQRSGEVSIGNLETALPRSTTRSIASSPSLPPTAKKRTCRISSRAAIEKTRQALQEVQTIRDTYFRPTRQVPPRDGGRGLHP